MQPVEAITAGIDWLTMTLPADNVLGDVWVNQGLAVLDEVAKDGYEIKARTMQGYYGASAGNCFVGSRDDGHMIQLTGHYANDHFGHVFRHTVHVSRIDVQTTVKYTELPPNMAKECYRYAEIDNERLPPARRRRLLLLSGSDGGDTCYIGSPSSEQRARIYNKAVQSGAIQYERSWRFEIVYKNDLATRLARTCPYNTLERAKWAEDVCYRWLSSRGILDTGIREGEMTVLPLGKQLASDAERRLNWIRKQVAPAMRQLVEQGYREQLLELVGDLLQKTQE